MNEALTLPEHDRAELVARLLESLGNAMDPDIDDAWAAEIERRCASSDSGAAVNIDWNDVRRRIDREVFGR